VSIPRQLLSLAHAEESLIAQGRIEELAALYDDRDRLITQLPERLSDAEVAVLEEAVGLQRRCAEQLREQRDAVAAELQHVGKGRDTVQAYAPAGVRPVRTLDAAG
jgi:hypothetical protein